MANTDLVTRIQARLGDIPIESTAAHGIAPDYIEATLIAWLAREFIADRPSTPPPSPAPATPSASAPYGPRHRSRRVP